MYRYKNLLVGLSIEDHDDTLVRYAELVSYMAHSHHVRFTHVLQNAEIFHELYPETYVSYQHATSELRDYLGTFVADRFVQPRDTKVYAELIEGAPLAELLRVAREDEVDLLVVGKDHLGGTLAEKLARKAPCSVLVVPAEVPAFIERVLVPIDFSDHAADAVDVAVAFAEAAGLEEVHMLHVFSLPTGYSKLGKTANEVRETMQQHAHSRYCTFLENLDLRGLTPVPHFAEGYNIPQTIHEQAEEIGANLIMIGTRGRTASAAILMGSVAEKMVRTAQVPVVAVKRKGVTLGLLDALFEL